MTSPNSSCFLSPFVIDSSFVDHQTPDAVHQQEVVLGGVIEELDGLDANRLHKIVEDVEIKEINMTTESSGICQRKRKNTSQTLACSRRRATVNVVEAGKSVKVVHVRARSGQATDSHSIAERVRRNKINQRLKLLRDIVPGCYEHMGMTVMLDETINYVQSLQNQIEFLSMKISAGTSLYNLNEETICIDAIQQIAKEQREGYQKVPNDLVPTMHMDLPPSLSICFGNPESNIPEKDRN